MHLLKIYFYCDNKADGYLCLEKKGTSNTQFCQFIDLSNGMTHISPARATGNNSVVTTLAKGVECQIHYTLDGTTTIFRFVYTVGTVPLA